MTLKIFSDKSYIPDSMEHHLVPLLFPFWGIPEFEKAQDNHLDIERYDNYMKIAPPLFQMTSLREADLAVFPAPWEVCRSQQGRELVISFAEQVNKAGKPLAVFVAGDLPEDDLPVDDAFIFHTSIQRSKKKSHTFALSTPISDLVEKSFGGILPVRQKQAKPTIGFCGYAPPLGISFSVKKFKEIVRLSLYNLGITKITSVKAGYAPRVKALLNLSKSPLVETNFIIRDGSPITWVCGYLLPKQDTNLPQQLRFNFLNNILESDYTLCVRGNGNYSIRLYETLCCGRIPIFVDTDCLLPYSSNINWKKYCIWIDEDEIPIIADKVADFHNSLSPQDFLNLQYECREFWKQWLSCEGFFTNFYRHFQ